MIRRLRWWINRQRPRCGAEPPWRLADAGTCILPRGHRTRGRSARDTAHADGTGVVWTADRWAWHGPVIDLADVLREHPARIEPEQWFEERSR